MFWHKRQDSHKTGPAGSAPSISEAIVSLTPDPLSYLVLIVFSSCPAGGHLCFDNRHNFFQLVLTPTPPDYVELVWNIGYSLICNALPGRGGDKISELFTLPLFKSLILTPGRRLWCQLSPKKKFTVCLQSVKMKMKEVLQKHCYFIQWYY